MGERGRVVVFGGSGFLGRSAAQRLAGCGYEVVIVSRTEPRERGPWRHVVWDGVTLGDWAGEVDGAAAVINLAGRTVDCVKTPDRCDEILRSRVDSTRAVGAAFERASSKPGVWVQMSTAHIYGDPPEATITEGSAFGYGLAPEVGKAWEAAFDASCPDGVRRVVLRTSFVIGRGGGALSRLRRIASIGLGGTVGSGRQGMSWIHQADMDAVFERAITDPGMRGAYIATGPEPVSNRVFMRRLRKAIGMPIGLPAAGWMVRLGAPLVLRTDPELALYGRYCVPRRLLDEGFEFRFGGLDAAFADLVGRGGD